MSRCLPFSPEAYSKRRSSHDALFKLQNEKEETKSLRRIEKDLKKKEKEKRKSLRRKEKDLKKKLREHADNAEKRHRHVTFDNVTKLGDEKYYQQTRIKADSKYQCPSKGIVYESENSEKSGVTEEFEPPTCSGSICNVPHRTENTNKRKRQDDSVDGIERQRVIFRIRLPLKKHSAPDTSSTELGVNCSSKQSDTCPQERTGKNNYIVNRPTNVEIEQPSSRPSLDLPSLAPERTQTGDAKKASSSGNDGRVKRSMYEMLIEDWVPPTFQQLQQFDDDDDEDWLFGSRKPHEQGSKRHQVSHAEVSFSKSTTLWPQAQLLWDVDIYALPYTVPF